jgi:hypothetical protein
MLRMLSSLDIRPHIGPIVSNDIMAGRLRNQQAPMSILVLRTNARRCGREPMKALGGTTEERSHAYLNPSNFQLVAALQIENFTGLVRGRDFEAETFDDLAGELHLLGVRCRHSAGRRP